MVFSSTTFLFLFLPIVLALYFVVRPGLRNIVLLVASLFFYAWGETFMVVVLIASCIVNYFLALCVNRARGGVTGKAVVGIAVVANLGLLGFFKYGNFLIDNVNVVIKSIGMTPVEISSIHLPIGISFFTFQAMSYVIDVYRTEANVQKNPINVALYISLFPQLIAGPIVRYRDIATQLTERSISMDSFAYGVRRFIIGLGKKVLIANTVAVAADAVFAIPTQDLTPGLAWLGAISYTLQIYFDFSGYSDMAIGLGHMFGFRFLENFNYPYISKSIREFWRRWHISLSTWFRDYLYIPLGGNRKSGARTYFNLITVFFLCGLWHGASWTFVVWGLYNGLFLVVERIGFGKWMNKRNPVICHLYAIFVVTVGWIFFRSETFTQAFAILATMAGFASGDGSMYNVPMYWNNELALALVAGIVGSTPWLPALGNLLSHTVNSRNSAIRYGVQLSSECVVLFMLVAIFVCSAMQLAAGTHNPFIYFRF